MRRRNNPILTLLIVLFCLVLLALAGYMLVQVLPQKAPQEVTTIETNSVFESDGQTVEPDREQAYEGELPSGVDTTPEPEPDTPSEPDAPEESSSENALISADADKRARETLASMTEDEKIWQLFYVTPELLTGVETATRAGDSTKEALEAMPVGGIIYFAKNLEDRAQSVEMLSNTKSYAKIPLFLGTDEEGGTVSLWARMLPWTQSRRRLCSRSASRQTPPLSIRQGRTLPEACTPSASTWTLRRSPTYPRVLLRSSARARLERTRSFCASLVGVMTGSIQTGGIIPCLKHFPGYGSAVTDDHYGTSVLEKTEAELESCDFLPFAAGIEAGAPFVMVSHLSVPEVVGDETPSDLSSKIVSDLLRNKLGFTGVIITDSHQMASITDHYTSGEAAVKALQAGVDMILMPQDLQAAFDGVKAALAGGTLTQSRIDESVLRILQVKAEYNILQ